MSPKKSTTAASTPVVVTPAPVAAPAETPAKTRRSASKKVDAPAAETPAPVKQTKKTVVKAEPVEDVDSSVEESGPKERRVVNKDTFDSDCTKYSDLIISEIEKLKNSETKQLKNKGIKLLRSLHKIFRQIHKDGNKLTKFKKTGNRKNNASSGFLKPVKISPEMSKFLSWDVTKTYSRTQVTKEICNYISKNKLNDPENKRNINCDAKLKALLKYDPANPPKDEKGQVLPLTYFRLQQYLKGHFIKEEVSAELDE